MRLKNKQNRKRVEQLFINVTAVIFGLKGIDSTLLL